MKAICDIRLSTVGRRLHAMPLIKFPITIAELLIRPKYKIHCLERSVVSFFCFAAYSHYNQIFQVKMHLNNKTLFLFRKDSISECT